MSLIGSARRIAGFRPRTADGERGINVIAKSYLPREHTATLCQSLAGVSLVSEHRASTTALAAEPAEESPRALITAAPRCCTEAMKSSFNHFSSSITSFAGRPLILAL